MRLLRQLKRDLTMQWRHGFFAAYAFVCGMYLVLLNQAPHSLRHIIVPFILATDPTVLGFFFVGGLILLERADHTLDAIAVTPLTTRDYLLAKVGSLTVLALVSSMVVGFGTASAMRPGLLTFAIALSAPLFVLIGVAVVSRCSTVNRYLIVSSIGMIPFMLPMLEPLGMPGGALFDWMPAGAALDLLAMATEDVPVPLWRPTAVLVPCNVLAWFWAHRWHDRYTLGRQEAA